VERVEEAGGAAMDRFTSVQEILHFEDSEETSAS
jgi:hypothetical protein